MGSVNEEETASAAGLINFVRTLSGAFATSLVTTSWQNRSVIAHAELANVADPTGQLAAYLPPGTTGPRDVQQSRDEPKPPARFVRRHSEH